MSIFQQRKSGNKREIEILGLKFKYTKKSKLNKEYTKNNNLLNYYLHKHLPLENQKWYMRQLFYKNLKYFPNFDNPQSINEKLTWLKLYFKNKEQIKCVDKITFKDYVKEQLGEGYTVPLLKVYDNVNQINFDELPEKFVLKSNCGWGSLQVVIVNDKSKANIGKIKRRINPWFLPWNCYYYQSFEWDYKSVTPKVFAEEYVEEMNGQVIDYKFWCFNGEPKMVLAISDRFKKMTINYYDMNWNLQSFLGKCPNSTETINKPKNFDKMVEIARKLAKPFPFVRVDFYEIGDKVMVGKMTFYPGGGLEPFEPREWDYKLGEMLELPEKREE